MISWDVLRGARELSKVRSDRTAFVVAAYDRSEVSLRLLTGGDDDTYAVANVGDLAFYAGELRVVAEYRNGEPYGPLQSVRTAMRDEAIRQV